METLRALSKQIDLFFWYMGCHTPHVCTDLSSPLTCGRGCPSLSLAAVEGGQATSSIAPSLLWVLGRECSEGCCLLSCTLQP